MKRIDFSYEDIDSKEFVDRLLTAYVCLDTVSQAVKASTLSVLCDVLAFKYWDENIYRPNSCLEQGDVAFDRAHWEWFANQMAKNDYVVDKNTTSDCFSGTVNEVLIDLAAYVTHRHFDYENERAVMELFDRKHVSIYLNTYDAWKVRYIIRMYRRKSTKESVFPLDSMVNNNIFKLLALGRDPSYLKKRRMLYFDETANNNRVHLLGGKLNISDLNKVFVLAGLDVSGFLTLDELKEMLGRTTDCEVKSTKFLGRNFVETLSKENFEKVIGLIEKKSWYLNFLAVQPLYFSMVDIVDSLNCYAEYDHFALKQALFDVFVESYPRFEKVFVRFNYPNIGKEKKDDFLDAVIGLVREFIDNHLHRVDCEDLIDALELGKRLDELVFLDEEKRLILIGNYLPFYQNRMIANPNSVIVFDGRDDLFKQKIDWRYTYNGTDVNWRPADSKDEPILQVADYVANIVHSFIEFADRDSELVKIDLERLTEVQRNRLLRFKRLYDRSIIHNPECFEYLVSIQLWTRISYLLGMLSAECKNKQ